VYHFSIVSDEWNECVNVSHFAGNIMCNYGILTLLYWCISVGSTGVNKNTRKYQSILIQIQEDYMAMYCLWQNCLCSWSVWRVMVIG